MDRAECRGKAPSRSRDEKYRDDWFPDRGQPYVDALETCFYCSVRRQCKDLRENLKPEYGVWGGKIQRRGKKAKLGPEKKAV